MYQYFVDNKAATIAFICIVAVSLCYFAVRMMQKIGMEKVRKTVYKAFVYAENHFNHGENRIKFEYVVQQAQKKIPAPFNLFITEKLLRDTIQLWFTLCKDLLDDGRINGTGDNEEEEEEK